MAAIGKAILVAMSVVSATLLVSADLTPAHAQDSCADLNLGGSKDEIHAALEDALNNAKDASNGGLGNEIWATLVDRDGVVCAVAFTGHDRNQQWLGSRVLSAQKANTATSFNLPEGHSDIVDALSTANLFTQVQPGGFLYGLQHGNPVNTSAAYGGDPANYGTTSDPMVGLRIGGINVVGGGLALYNSNGDKRGGLGVDGDTSCADHNIAWRTRHELQLDKLSSGGVRGLSAAPRQDNIIYDIPNDEQHPAIDTSASGFGHPLCGFGEEAIAPTLPATE
jgi:uncharacterized protein GlcG (DUF336 family)